MKNFGGFDKYVYSITSSVYQKWASSCIANFLANFQPSSKNQRRALKNKEEIPIAIRINENPTSVQIIQSPEGGIQAGIQRIREKLSFPEATEPQTPLIFLPSLVIANEKDLTRECIILTLRDITVEKIIGSGLLSPEEIVKLINTLRKDHPDFFVAVQRYIIGIEHKDGFKVPYKVITEKDEETLKYLENLPGRLHNF